jgi:hypothetical protein
MTMDRHDPMARTPTNTLRVMLVLTVIMIATLVILAATTDATPDATSSASLANGQESFLAETEEAAEEAEEAQEARAGRLAKARTGVAIGVHGAAGWGSTVVKDFLANHITWNRVEVGMPSNTAAESIQDGFKTLAIVGNVEDGKALSKVEPVKWGAEVVSQLKANPGIAIAEAGNEMYYKGGIAEPAQYGKLYVAAVEAMKKAGIKTPLLFNMEGDYEHKGVWSYDAHGGGWLRDAVNANKGLAAAIAANGISIHPYGAIGENMGDTHGSLAPAADEAVAQAVLGSIPPFYITEFGYNLSACGISFGACNERQQASKLRRAYKAFLADPHVAGIFWYQSHDDGTGHFGLMSSSNGLRPSFASLEKIGRKQGQ